VLLAHYVKPPFAPAELDIFVESMLSTRTGDDHWGGSRVAGAGRVAAAADARANPCLAGRLRRGGQYRETAIQDSGHGPHLDQPAEFRAALAEHLAGTRQR
jgi:pimeloyl-ACP methyl ester carboxylesterase